MCEVEAYNEERSKRVYCLISLVIVEWSEKGNFDARLTLETRASLEEAGDCNGISTH